MLLPESVSVCVVPPTVRAVLAPLIMPPKEPPPVTVKVAAAPLSMTPPVPLSAPMELLKPPRSSVPLSLTLELGENAVMLPAWTVSPLLIVVRPPKVLLPLKVKVCVVPPTVRAVFEPVMLPLKLPPPVTVKVAAAPLSMR